MLNSDKFQEVYDKLTTNWIMLHMDDTNTGEMLCDLCGKPPANGILYNIPAENGNELLVCYDCYITSWNGNRGLLGPGGVVNGK